MAADDDSPLVPLGTVVRDTLDTADSQRERSHMRAMVEHVARWFAEHDLDEARARFAARLRLRDA